MMNNQKKSWYRIRNISLMVILVLIVSVGVVVVQALTAKPGMLVNYNTKIVELAKQYQTGADSEKNSWDDLLRAVDIKQAAMTGIDPQTVDFAAIYAPDNINLDDCLEKVETLDQLREIAETVIRNAEEKGLDAALDSLIISDYAIDYTKNQEAPIMLQPLPYLGDTRALANMQIARIKLAAEQGNFQQAVHHYEQTMALGRVIAGQPFIIERLVGISIQTLTRNQIKPLLMSQQLDDEMLTAFSQATKHQQFEVPMEFSLQAMHFMVKDLIQRVYTDNGQGNGRMVMSRFNTLNLGSGFSGGASMNSNPIMDNPLINVTGLYFASRKQVSSKAEAFFSEAIRLSKIPVWKQKQKPFNPESDLSDLSPRYFLLDLTMPSISGALKYGAVATLEQQGILLMIALERYHNANGSYPQTLADLVPEFIAEVPQDPFCQTGFVYQLTTAADASPSYQLYSVGYDGQDNQAKQAEKPVFALSKPGLGTGFDYVINSLE